MEVMGVGEKMIPFYNQACMGRELSYSVGFVGEIGRSKERWQPSAPNSTSSEADL